MQRQGPDGLLWWALLLSRTSRLLRDLVWRILIAHLGGETISCLMNMMLWKRNLVFHKESFHFREGVIRILSASKIEKNWNAFLLSDYLWICKHLGWIIDSSRFPGFCSSKHTHCRTETIRNTMFASKELRFDHLANSSVKARKVKMWQSRP